MQIRKLGFRVTTTLAVLVFVGSGIAMLGGHEHIADDMKIMGYPAFFLSILGGWKVLGAATVALPGAPSSASSSATHLLAVDCLIFTQRRESDPPFARKVAGERHGGMGAGHGSADQHRRDQDAVVRAPLVLQSLAW